MTPIMVDAFRSCFIHEESAKMSATQKKMAKKVGNWQTIMGMYVLFRVGMQWHISIDMQFPDM